MTTVSAAKLPSGDSKGAQSSAVNSVGSPSEPRAPLPEGLTASPSLILAARVTTETAEVPLRRRAWLYNAGFCLFAVLEEATTAFNIIVFVRHPIGQAKWRRSCSRRVSADWMADGTLEDCRQRQDPTQREVQPPLHAHDCNDCRPRCAHFPARASVGVVQQVLNQHNSLL